MPALHLKPENWLKKSLTKINQILPVARPKERSAELKYTGALEGSGKLGKVLRWPCWLEKSDKNTTFGEAFACEVLPSDKSVRLLQVRAPFAAPAYE